MDSEGKDGEKSEQKSPFENLSHPELVKRCTKFLSIAQSAKHAKDTYRQLLSETETKVKHLEEQLSKYQQDHGSRKVQCKECENHQKEELKLQNQISAMEEMVATLTEQKLSTAMEIDRLKKQNKIVESRLSDLTGENLKLKAELDERSDLEIRLEAAESELKSLDAKHQLCDGNKESQEDTSLLQLLRSEVETLNRDLEVLSNDNKNKSEEIKRFSERFHNEKCALEAELKSVSSKLQSISHMNDYLKEQVRVVSEEKDVVLKGIESIKTNNFELNQLVESIGSERDECLHSVEKLNAEKSKLSKLVNALNGSKTTILEENVSLKSEKQHLNECLKKLTCERDSLQDSVTLAETHLSRLLQRSLGVLQNLELSLGNHSVQCDHVTDDKKMELVEIISTLDDVLSKLCTILNTQSCEPCVCSNGVDISVDKKIDCSRFLSFESAEEKSVFTQELAVLSAQLSKLCNVAVSFKSHESSSDVNIFLKRIIHFLKVNVSVLETELEKQCASTDSINKELVDVETTPCLEQKLKLDNNLNCESEILQDKANSSLEDNTISVQSNSLKQYIGTQTESTTEEICEKCVQTDVCSLDSSSFTDSFVQDNEKVTKEIEDSNLHEYDDKNEEVHVKTLEDQLQALRVKYQEISEKLKCTEKEQELLQSVVKEKDADMNKFLDVLLCFNGKNSKNVMNQVFEKLQKDKASCEVGSIGDAVGNFLSQNFIEQLALTEESECANRISVDDGDVLTNSDASASQTCVQNIVDLQKTEILHLNELKSLSETQSSIISSQEREICSLNKTIEELTKAVSGSGNKIADQEAERSCDTTDGSCSRVAEEQHEISAGDESEACETEKEDQASCELDEQDSQLPITCDKQEDEMHNLQKALDERNNEIENLKTELQDIKENFEDPNRFELLKLVEGKTNEIEQYKAEIEALKLEIKEASEKFQQEIIDKNKKVDSCKMKVEDAENLSTMVESELLQKLKMIEEQKDEINNYRQKVLDVQDQLEQLSHQLLEKEEITTKLYSDIENYKQQIADFEWRCQELENQVRENQRLIADKDCEIESGQKKFEGIEEQLKKIEVDFIEKEEMCSEKVKEIETLQKGIGELQEKYSEIEQKFRQEQQTVSERDTEVEKLSNGIVERNSKIEGCMKEIEDIKNHLRETIAQKDAEIEEHKKESLNMQCNLDGMRNNISEEKHLFEQRDKDTENHRKQIENIMQQCMEAGIKLAEKQQIINEMSQNIEEYKRNIMNMQENFNGIERNQQKSIDDMHGEIARLRNDLAVATASFTDKTTELTIVKEELCSLKSDNSSWTKTIDDMSAELDNTKLEAAKKEETLKEKIQEIEDLQGSKEALVGKLRVVGASLRELWASHHELLHEGQQLRSSVSLAVALVQQELCRTVESTLASSKMEVKELLGEMNEMNQVLKQRGETISKLKELKTELEQRWESASSELLATREILSERVAELAEKDNKIRTMEEQLEVQMMEHQTASREQQDAMDLKLQKSVERIAELESRIAQLDQEHEESQKEGGEVHSEVMSSSTISKMEETARLRDLEGSFEERFTKLRVFTIKLKKKASDLKEQLTQSEAEKSKLVSEKAELLSKISVMSGHTKNLQTLQQEYDSLQDEIEAQKSEVKSLKKALEAAVNDSTAVKLDLQNCREERESFSRELENCAKSKQKLDTSVKELLSQVQNLKKEKDAENIARKEKETVVKRLEEELKLKEVRIAEEIENVKLLNDKIEESKQESVKNNVLSLEMAAYEEQLKVVKSQQRELSERMADREATIGELKARLEQKMEHCESVTLQLAELASEKQSLVDSFRSQQDLLTRQISALEEKSTKLKDSLAEREDELANLHDEYECYKVRAQSVLRQKARGEELSQFSREDLLEETRQLTARVETLQVRLEEINLQLQSSLLEQDVLREEKTALLERCQELANSLSQARTQLNQLQEAEKKTTSEHQEAMRNQKLQYDTLTQCYKSQIEELEARLRDETSTLRQRLEIAEDLIQKQKQQVSGSGDTYSHPHLQKITADGKVFEPAKSEVEISLLKREDAEGSESTNSVSPNHLVSRDHLHHPVPLDKLLASTDEDSTMVKAGSVSGEDLARVMDQAAVAEQQVRHLSALLSDAEQDLAKLTQQNGLLKEEIRRQQRSIEREQHAQNLEYLKNVVVKFATLQNGDERSRLIPVLNTILKLSPEETSQLSQVARGGLESAGGARGWGSYLHLWPGAQ